MNTGVIYHVLCIFCSEFLVAGSLLFTSLPYRKHDLAMKKNQFLLCWIIHKKLHVKKHIRLDTCYMEVHHVLFLFYYFMLFQP